MADVIAVTGMLGGPGLLALDAAAVGRARPTTDPWLDVLAAAVEEGDVLVLARGAEAHAVRRRLARVQTLLATERIALVSVPLAPLAAGVLADAVARAVAAGALVPAQVPAAVAHAAGSCLDLGVVATVARIDVPEVGVWHQLRSYLPWTSRFVVRVAPTAGLGHLAAKDGEVRGLDLTLPGEQELRAVTAGVELPPALQQLLDATGVSAADLGRPEIGPLLRAAWAQDGATELVVRPASDQGWLGLGAEPTALTTCTWCGRSRVGTSCLFCGEWDAREDRAALDQRV